MQQVGKDVNLLTCVDFLPVVLAVTSIPLLMAFYIKTGALPSGLIFVFFYSWSIVSVFLVPVLLILELVVLMSRLSRKPIGAGMPLKWHIGAALVGFLAIAIAIWVRQLQIP